MLFFLYRDKSSSGRSPLRLVLDLIVGFDFEENTKLQSILISVSVSPSAHRFE